MLLLLHPRRLSAPVDRSSSDTATATEAVSTIAPLTTDSFGWYYLGHVNKVPKRRTLLYSITSPVPGEDRRLPRLKDRYGGGER